MKFISCVLCSIILLTFCITASAQKYRYPADTVKLNEEYIKVSNDIATLDAQLTVAQNNLPGYESKATNAGQDAQSAASVSSNGAAKATDGNIGDSRTAKHNADKAYDKAKDARSANNKVGRQDDKIRKLKASLTKKRQRLHDLDEMRAAIYAQLPSNSN